MKLLIDPSVLELFPEVRLGVVRAHDIDNTRDRQEVLDMLRRAEQNLPRIFGDGPVTSHPSVAVWRDAYRKFGAKPKETPSSVENLVWRVLWGGSVRPVNPLVSLYNVISLTHLIPVGGEDLDRLSGDVRLTRAGHAEPPVLLLGFVDAANPPILMPLRAHHGGRRRWTSGCGQPHPCPSRSPSALRRSR